MLTEFRKSTNAILFERVTSPFFGTLITSWLVWNWKIVYFTLFVSQSKIKGTKIEYIEAHFYDLHNLITFPLLSVLVLITVVPFISNGAFWFSLKFKKWRVDQKNEIEKKQLITVEQSISIRTELRDKEIEFEKVLTKKNDEVDLLKSQINVMEERLKIMGQSRQNSNRKVSSSGSYSYSDYIDFKDNKKAFEPFEEIARMINETSQLPDDISKLILEYYLLNDIIEHKMDVDGYSYYELTFKGKNFYKELYNEKFDSK